MIKQSMKLHKLNIQINVRVFAQKNTPLQVEVPFNFFLLK